MKSSFLRLMRSQIQAGLNDPTTLVSQPVPRGGRLKLMRQALGMTAKQLATLLKSSRANVSALERREAAGTISLNSLEATAKAMHCRLVYFLIPEQPLDKLLEDQARLVAKKRLQAIEHSMELEQQGLTVEQKRQQEQELIQELLYGNPKNLWKPIEEI